MIRGIHGLFYSADAKATRAFMRDKLKLPFSDVGDGWLIFDLPEGDVGVHPLDEEGKPSAGTHDISFYCDDIASTMAELRARGVTFKSEVADHGYGLVTYFTMPGGVEVQLYEPKYEKRGSKKPKAASKPARGVVKAKRVKGTAGKPATRRASRGQRGSTRSRRS